jgi:hypothetical protein
LEKSRRSTEAVWKRIEELVIREPQKMYGKMKERIRAGIFKRVWDPGIDSKE